MPWPTPPDGIRATAAETGSSIRRARPPASAEERASAWRALLACPTGSIGAPRVPGPPAEAFPWQVAPGVFLTGYNSPESFGAHAYFVPTSHGNFLVDAPRFTPRLVEAFRARGGLDHIVLTHRDDVADYDRYAEVFGARVWIHRADADAAPDATDVFDEERAVFPGLRAFPLPGHTRGSAAYLWKDEFLFTGDSLAWSRTRQDLHAFRDATWYSWPRQAASLESLAEAVRFSWVLPGHGGWWHAPADEMRQRLLRLVGRMRADREPPAW